MSVGTVYGPLWRSDGTAAGTSLVVDVQQNQFKVDDLAVIGGVGYFTTGHELWRTDGTPEGTSLVHGFDGQGYWLTGLGGGRFMFTSSGFGFGSEYKSDLWVSDGTPGGTRLVKEFNPYNATDGAIGQLVVANGTAYFSAAGPDTGTGLQGAEL